MTTTQIKALNNAVIALDIECGELILAPESAEEHAINSQIAETLRLKVAAITAMIRSMSTPVDVAPSDMGSLSQAPIGSALWNRHDVGWWPDYIPLFDRGPVTEIHDARALLQDAGVEAPIDGLVYCVCKLPICTIGICVFGDTGYEFQIPVVSTPLDIAPLPDPPSEIYLPPTAAEFIKLVRDGKVQVETPSGDTTNALIDRASVGWARIGWDYELGDDNEWVAYHDSTVIDELTVFQRVDHKVSANGVTFIIEP